MSMIIIYILFALGFAFMGYLYYGICRIADLLGQLALHVSELALTQSLGKKDDRYN